MFRTIALAALTAAVAPVASAATITLPAPLEVTYTDGTEKKGTVYDTYVRSEEIWIRTDAPVSNCSVTTATGESVAPDGSQWFKVTLDPATPAGLHTIACTGASNTVDFVVVASDPHEAMWFGRETAATLAAKYNLRRHSEGKVRYETGAQPGDGDWWVRLAGWWYVLSISNYETAIDGIGGVCDSGDDGTTMDADEYWSVPRASDEAQQCVKGGALDLMATGGAHIRILRLALSALLAEAYVDGAYTNDTHLPNIASDLLEAAIYWGTTTAAVAPSHTAWTSMSDIEKARFLTASAVAYDWLFSRLDPDKRHAWLMGLAALTEDFYDDGANGVNSHLSGHWSDRPAIEQRDVLLNGHAWENNSGVGIVAYALEFEMCAASGSCTNPVWNAWHDDPEAAFTAIESWQPADGSDPMGVYYAFADQRALYTY